MSQIIRVLLFSLVAGGANHAPPSYAAAPTQPTSAHATKAAVDVALELNQGRTALSVSLDGGAPILVNYDTGAQGIVIRASFAEKRKMAVIGEVLLGSPNGGTPIPAKIVQFKSLSVGGVLAKSAPRSLDAVMVDDAKMLSNADVIIGSNQFPDSLIELDFQNRRFRLRPADASVSRHWQPTDERGLLAGTMKLSGQTVPLHIDSGNPGLLDLPVSALKHLKLLSPLRENGKIVTFGNSLVVQTAALDTQASLAGTDVRLKGNFRFAAMPFANLGTGALKQAKLQIDTANRRWQLKFDAKQPLISGGG